MNYINFSYNWNNKLDNLAFTSIRLRNDEKYHIGKTFEVVYQKMGKGAHEIRAIKHLKLDEINEFIARIDTGYSSAKAINILKTMYKNKNIDWDRQQLSLLLLVKLKDNKGVDPQLELDLN